MSPFVVFPYYLAWHYTYAIRDFFTIWGNLQWFIYQFFSISVLLKTLFSPFKRLKEKGADSLIDFEGFFESLIVNIVMRLVGFILRTIIIIFGLVVLVLSFFIGIFAFLFWLILPFLILFLIVVSLVGFLNFN